MRTTRAAEADDGRVRERFVRVVGLPAVSDEGADELGPGSDSAGLPAALGSPPVLEPATRTGLAAFDPGRRGVRALAVVAAVAVAIAAGAAWLARPKAQPVPTRVEVSTAAAPAASSGSLVVAVAGRVQRPGLVRLPTGSRVADAIEAAGGPLPDTDLSFVNLARKLVDGELVLIGVTPPPGGADSGGGGGPGGPVGPINLNTATLDQLQTLPGVGPVTAQHIVDYRTKHSGFRSVSELRQVDGIGDSRYAQLKDLVTV